MRETLLVYTKLKKRLGKKPTLKDCREAKVEIAKALEVFGGKRAFDEFITRLEG
jgi:hypothetical protein